MKLFKIEGFILAIFICLLITEARTNQQYRQRLRETIALKCKAENLVREVTESVTTLSNAWKNFDEQRWQWANPAPWIETNTWLIVRSTFEQHGAFPREPASFSIEATGIPEISHDGLSWVVTFKP